MRFREFDRVATLLKQGKLSKYEIARATGSNDGRVKRIAELLRLVPGSPIARWRTISQRTESRFPAEVEAFKEFRKHMAVKKAAAKAGIDPNAATRIDRARPEWARAAQKSRLVSAARTSGKRPAIRKMLSIKNPDGTFRFPMSTIALAAGVSILAAKNANRAKPAVRSVNENVALRNRFNRILKDRGLMEMYQREARIKFENFYASLGNDKRLLALGDAEKTRLREYLLSHRTLVLPEAGRELHGRADFISNTPDRISNRRAVMQALLDSRDYALTPKQLLRVIPNEKMLYGAIEELGVSSGIGLLIHMTKTGLVKLNSDVVLLLEN